MSATSSEGKIEIFDYSNEAHVKYIKSIQTPCVQTGIWYLQYHDIWLSAGKDNRIRQWKIAKYDDFD